MEHSDWLDMSCEVTGVENIFVEIPGLLLTLSVLMHVIIFPVLV